ncbi:MAG: FMN-binding protein [Candidatus Fermentibacteraceae bacterium]|nr:FMN-binding protein [Candidatus Fermentibacteraceae bacterium]MBN2608590.1 FMN-binding protein [Candidatus Fermentibacteraceae bacterium]
MKKKKVLKILGIIVFLLIIAAAFFKFRYDKMVRTIEAQTVEDVDLGSIDDGIYSGSFGDFLVRVSLDVTVSGGRITDIRITDQQCGPGYEALETVDRILEAQSPAVDAVSGATGSSRCIMISVARALAESD